MFQSIQINRLILLLGMALLINACGARRALTSAPFPTDPPPPAPIPEPVPREPFDDDEPILREPAIEGPTANDISLMVSQMLLTMLNNMVDNGDFESAIIGLSALIANTRADLDALLPRVAALEGRINSLTNAPTGTFVQMYRCPALGPGSLGGGQWGFYGCLGQLTDSATCFSIEWPTTQVHQCTPAGRIRVY